jgi:predicted HicB family RNase H-like nuclease
MKRKRGRPPVKKSDKKSVVLRYRLTKGEYRDLCDEADHEGLSLSAFIRKKLKGGKA